MLLMMVGVVGSRLSIESGLTFIFVVFVIVVARGFLVCGRLGIAVWFSLNVRFGRIE